MLPDSGVTKPRRRPRTRRDSVLDLLRRQDWVCGTELADAVGWAFGSRISELRAFGHSIEKRQCENTGHRHGATVYEYGFLVDGAARIAGAERRPNG